MINQYNSIYAPTKPSHIPPNGKFGKSSTEKCRLEWDMWSETQEGITVVSYQVSWTWQPCYIFTEGVGYFFFGGGEPYNFTRWANISNYISYITSLWHLKTVSFDLKCQLWELWEISRPLRHVFNTDVGSMAALHWDTGTPGHHGRHHQQHQHHCMIIATILSGFNALQTCIQYIFRTRKNMRLLFEAGRSMLLPATTCFGTRFQVIGQVKWVIIKGFTQQKGVNIKTLKLKKKNTLWYYN